jgi:hypothetical protein
MYPIASMIAKKGRSWSSFGYLGQHALGTIPSLTTTNKHFVAMGTL